MKSFAEIPHGENVFAEKLTLKERSIASFIVAMACGFLVGITAFTLVAIIGSGEKVALLIFIASFILGFLITMVYSKTYYKE